MKTQKHRQRQTELQKMKQLRKEIAGDYSWSQLNLKIKKLPEAILYGEHWENRGWRKKIRK